MYLITSEQIRGCRAILRWTVEELAEKSGISISTLMRMEKNESYTSCRVESVERVTEQFNKIGILSSPNDGVFLITTAQIRACRAILRWSIGDLSKRTGISVSTLNRIEKTDGYHNCRIETIEKIRTTFEETNAVHLPDKKTIIMISNENS